MHARVSNANVATQVTRASEAGAKSKGDADPSETQSQGATKIQAALRSKRTRQTDEQHLVVAWNAESMMEEFAQGFLADRTMAAFSTNQIEEEAEKVAQQKRELEMKRKRLKDRNSTIAIELEMRCQAFAELHQEMKAAIGLIAQRTKLQEVTTTYPHGATKNVMQIVRTHQHVMSMFKEFMTVNTVSVGTDVA